MEGLLKRKCFPGQLTILKGSVSIAALVLMNIRTMEMFTIIIQCIILVSEVPDTATEVSQFILLFILRDFNQF